MSERLYVHGCTHAHKCICYSVCSLEKRHRVESAALVDAPAKRCKLRTEAESARAEAVKQRTSFADLEESKSRLISEHGVFMPILLQARPSKACLIQFTS